MLVSTCEASAHPCTGRVTVLHPSWWPRSRRLARSSAALVTIASLQAVIRPAWPVHNLWLPVPLACGHRHRIKIPPDDLSRFIDRTL